MTGRANPLLDPRRSRGEALAFQAEQAWAGAKFKRARELFAAAAALEEEVAREVPTASPRLRSLLSTSAAALWYKAANFERAKQVAYSFLAAGEGLTKQGRRELEQLVDRSSREAELGEVANDPKMVPIEVKLTGGHVGVGIAPARAARDRGRAVISLLTRSAEFAADLGYREHGGSDLDRSEQLRIFEAPALAASYGLRFYVSTDSKRPAATAKVVAPERVVQTFLELADAATGGPEAVRLMVPDARYAQAFISGFGELAPDGEDVARVECSAPSWKLPNAGRTVFEPQHRLMLRASVAGEGGTSDRQVRARVVAASLSKSTIELEIAGDKIEGERAGVEKIEGSVIPRSTRFLRGLRLDDVYDFDLKVMRAADAAPGHSHARLEIRSATGATPQLEPSSTPRAAAQPTSDAVLRWSKPLTPTDALQNEGNQRPYVQLTRSGQAIDHATWFRRTMFNDAAWSASGKGGELEAHVDFDVMVKEVAFGTHKLRLSHLVSRAEYHSQPATRLHWSGEVRKLLERNDFTHKYLVLQRDSSGHHQLAIVDERPAAVAKAPGKRGSS